MYRAVESGLVQTLLGHSARDFQERIETGEQPVIGVNCYQDENQVFAEPEPYRPNRDAMAAHVAELIAYKAARGQDTVQRHLDSLARVANSADQNIFAAVVDAAEAGLTHGEIIACLRRELGFGQPLVVV